MVTRDEAAIPEPRRHPAFGARRQSVVERPAPKSWERVGAHDAAQGGYTPRQVERKWVKRAIEEVDKRLEHLRIEAADEGGLAL